MFKKKKLEQVIENDYTFYTLYTPRTSMLNLPALVAVTTLFLGACSATSEPPAPDAQPAPEVTRTGPDPVALWSLCSAHAKGEVSGDWRFGYPADAKVRAVGKAYRITGSVTGPMDQTFALACTYKDVDAEGATMTAYSLQ